MLHERGFIAACDGNLSVRLDKHRVLVTPTAMSKGMMKPADLVIVDMAGRKLEGRREDVPNLRDGESGTDAGATRQ